MIYFGICQTIQRKAIKIGYAKNVVLRFKNHNATRLPEDHLELAFVLEGSVKDERAIQKKFKKYKIQGEYFEYCDEILQYGEAHHIHGAFEEHLEEYKERMRKYRQSPEAKERMRKYSQSPEAKERHRESDRKYSQSPEVKERRRKYRQSPEVKERRRKYRQSPEVKERRRKYRQKKKAEKQSLSMQGQSSLDLLVKEALT
jgi:hypothetical protein